MRRICISNAERFAFKGHGIAAGITAGGDAFLDGPAILMARPLQMIGIGCDQLPFRQFARQHLGKGLHIGRPVIRRIRIGDILGQHALARFRPAQPLFGKGYRSGLCRVHNLILARCGPKCVKKRPVTTFSNGFFPPNLLDSPVNTDLEDSTGAEASRHGLAVLAAIKAMGESLTQAEASLAEGYALDLAGLDTEIGRLCAAAGAAPAAMAPALRRNLEALLVQVERLQAALPRPNNVGEQP
jgi:hypothetical protein